MQQNRRLVLPKRENCCLRTTKASYFRYLDASRYGWVGIWWSKSIYPELPILMISGHGTIETAVQAIRNGAYDFIENHLKKNSY